MLKKRAERFGQVLSSSLSKVDEEEKILKRKERFGDVTSSANNTVKSSADATTTPSKFAKITFGSADDVSNQLFQYLHNLSLGGIILPSPI